MKAIILLYDRKLESMAHCYSPDLFTSRSDRKNDVSNGMYRSRVVFYLIIGSQIDSE